MVTFALAVGAIVFGLSQGPTEGWGDPRRSSRSCSALLLLPVFVLIERRAANPTISFSLLRHDNFLAANLSQFLAGMVELGLGFLTPFFLLLVVGVSPATAGICLIPATIPIILAGPLAGRAFDRFGGRWPLVVGFLVLAASGVVLAVSVSQESAVALIPGLLLQGLGLGIVLTVNDPTGLTAVPPEDGGEAAGMINTSEQLGGAIGIAALTAVELGVNFNTLNSKLAEQGLHPTPAQKERAGELITQAEQLGLKNVPDSHLLDVIQPRRDRLPRRRLPGHLRGLGRDRPARRARHPVPRPQDRPGRGRADLRPPLALDLRHLGPFLGDQQTPAALIPETSGYIAQPWMRQIEIA